jgi:hypothetical protein
MRVRLKPKVGLHIKSLGTTALGLSVLSGLNVSLLWLPPPWINPGGTHE